MLCKFRELLFFLIERLLQRRITLFELYALVRIAFDADLSFRQVRLSIKQRRLNDV